MDNDLKTFSATLRRITHEIGSHGYGGTETTYHLRVGERGELIRISDQDAEQVMLAQGLGEHGWIVDHKRERVIPKVKEFVGFGTPFFATKEEAEDHLRDSYRSQIDKLQRKLDRV